MSRSATTRPLADVMAAALDAEAVHTGAPTAPRHLRAATADTHDGGLDAMAAQETRDDSVPGPVPGRTRRTTTRPGTILKNTYVLGQRLGAVGMGEVFEASHTRLRRRFAVKVLSRRHTDSLEAFARFRREAEISSRLGHPNIVEVIDFDHTDEGQPFLVMELLDGEDLAARIERGPVPVAAALRIAEQLGNALAAAHAQGIVHRDLKPPNVFLCRRGDDEDWV
jgi:serine/threonine protein kinase